MRRLLHIKRISPFDAAVSSLINQLDHYQESLYPAESNHLDSRQTLSEPNCCFLGAYKDDALVGIGAAKILNGEGELKRFYVLEGFRGQGISECLIVVLEKWLCENGVSRSYLETGIHQHAAIRFYEKLGYFKCGPFGNYKEDPLSVFMNKDISLEDSLSEKSNDPFCVVYFSSQLRSPAPGYVEVADQMVALVRKQDGFLGLTSFRGQDSRGFTASYWKDLESISRWGQNPQHAAAQNLGRTSFYENFKITTAKVESL